MLKIAVFDAYGTLFDVNGAARALAARPEGAALAGVWQKLAQDWRDKQLAYSWLRAAAGKHSDFRSVTEDALAWALEAQGLADAGLQERLMELYDRLPAYPEAKGVIGRLRARGLKTAILSNGTPAMLAAATATAGLDGLFDAVLSVEAAGIYKPAPQVYALIERRFDIAPAETLFASSNGWDAAGAAGFGFTVAWINRAGLPRDRLWAGPGHECANLTGLEGLA